MEINLSGKYKHIRVMIDDNWGKMFLDGDITFVYRDGYAAVYTGCVGKYSSDFVHQIIMDTKTDGRIIVIDHINQDKLDNREANLRLVSKSVNGLNSSKLRVDNTSGVKGVSFCKRDNRWRSYLSINGKRVYEKYFRSKEEACLVSIFNSKIKLI